MDQITPLLWISDISTVRNKSTDQFDRIITTCQDSVEDNINCVYSQFNLADDIPNSNLYGGDTSYEAFIEAVNAVHTALCDREKVLVHCHAGQNRSIAVCTAALGQFKGLDYETAAKQISEQRPIANPTELYISHARRYLAETTN